MHRPVNSRRGPVWVRLLLTIAGVGVLGLLGYFASAGTAGPLSPAADTTTTSSTTDSTTTGSTSTTTSTSTTESTTTTAPTTTTTSTTTTTTPDTGPAGQIKLANGRTSIPVSSVSLPARLIIDGVRFTPGLVVSRNRPVSVRVHVSDTRGYVVRDALVFVRATPLVTSTPAEQATDQAGYVTLSMFPRATFPLRRGYHVQFFVRTRKEGDSLLAGVSSRRLVQVATAR